VYTDEAIIHVGDKICSNINSQSCFIWMFCNIYKIQTVQMAWKMGTGFINSASQQCTGTLGAVHKWILNQTQHSTHYPPGLFTGFRPSDFSVPQTRKYQTEKRVQKEVSGFCEIQVKVFWGVAPQSVVVGNHRFRGQCCPPMMGGWMDL